MEGGDFSRGMGQEGDPEINAGGHTLFILEWGATLWEECQFLYWIMRGACYRYVGNLNLCWMRGGIT